MDDHENFPYVSLCRVKSTYQNKAPQLERIADFYDDEFHLAHQIDSPTRNTLYDSKRNGFPEGFIGVWKWCTVPNIKTGAPDFIKSKFYSEMMPPEIFFLPNCYTKEDLKNALVDGVETPSYVDKFIFAVHPFVEDLLIEPRSLYNYFLPVFTELISDRLASRNFVDFYPSEERKKSFCEQYKYNPDEIPVSAQERMNKLLKDTRKILKENFDKDNIVSEYAELFTKFPLAYVTGNAEKFLDDFNGSERTSERIRRFMEK